VGVWRYHQLDAWQLADAFRAEVFRLVRIRPALRRDFKFRSQLVESARAVNKDITEGFVRRSPPTFVLFLTSARASLAEAEEHLRDAIELEYLTVEECAQSLQLAKRCSVATSRLRKSQENRPPPPPRPRTKPRRPGQG
jgi:four helix bundle protein